MLINSGHIASSRFFLDIQGWSAGYLPNFGVPTYEAEEAGSALGPDYVTRKMLGPPKIGDATATCNVSEAGPLLSWIESVWKRDAVVKDTTVSLADQNYQVKLAVEMDECLITEVSLPELNASDGKKPFEVSTKWRPTQVRFTEPGGVVPSTIGQKAKPWLVNNFRVHGAFGLDTRLVTKIGLPKMTMKVANEAYGEFRHPELLYSAIEFSTITMSLSFADRVAAKELAHRMITRGNVHEEQEEDIAVDVMAPNLQQTLGSFTMKNCLLKKIDWGKLEGGKDGPALINLEFLVEDLRFQITHK